MKTALIPLLAIFAAVPGWAQQNCAALTRTPLQGIRIAVAEMVPAGSFAVPGGRGGPVQVPAFCRVAAETGSEVKFEIWMPVDWNRKLLAVGNGGLAGAIAYGGMVRPLQLGYATSSTDTGHASASTSDASWALGHYERIVDFADRGVHQMALADKAILQAFYTAPVTHSYFSGCSQGGHEALIEAQRYPTDFDGIVAGDPANWWTRHYAGGHVYSALVTEGDAYIPAAKVQILADAVNEACDALDGVRDGILNDPRRCHFNPETLLCKGPDTAACLTKAQVGAVQKIWTGLRSTDGEQLYPPLVPGGEAGPGGWANWITGPEPGRGGHANLGVPFFRYMVFDNPAWDFRTFRFDAAKGTDSDIDYMDAKLGALFNATNPDLSRFRANGGRLIQYHGWSDPDITPLNSINYYESVVRQTGGDGSHGLRDTKEFYRLFMVPGMQHCQGGPGAASFDMVSALASWVEKGIAPDRVVASHVTNGVVDRTRPLCAYPSEAQWNGSGSTDDAANFTCVLP
ncbi:MAG: tannase/feruloyl esterase family alpha/beta hydrolase [Acidobacteriota bacterium]|nr:tannase/feruloyl esterase family alpha/beta hydrolase [Acidobacteriota bacterium]